MPSVRRGLEIMTAPSDPCGAFCTAAAQHYVASVASSPPWTVERDARRAPDILGEWSREIGEDDLHQISGARIRRRHREYGRMC